MDFMPKTLMEWVNLISYAAGIIAIILGILLKKDKSKLISNMATLASELGSIKVKASNCYEVTSHIVNTLETTRLVWKDTDKAPIIEELLSQIKKDGERITYNGEPLEKLVNKIVKEITESKTTESK